MRAGRLCFMALVALPGLPQRSTTIGRFSGGARSKDQIHALQNVARITEVANPDNARAAPFHLHQVAGLRIVSPREKRNDFAAVSAIKVRRNEVKLRYFRVNCEEHTH